LLLYYSREFIITINTPGIKDKNEIRISIGDSYNVIIIEGYLSRKDFHGKKLESRNPIYYGSFQAEIELPER
jgi:HSP20 family molecular chaperone IbpA